MNEDEPCLLSMVFITNKGIIILIRNLHEKSFTSVNEFYPNL